MNWDPLTVVTLFFVKKIELQKIQLLASNLFLVIFWIYFYLFWNFVLGYAIHAFFFLVCLCLWILNLFLSFFQIRWWVVVAVLNCSKIKKTLSYVNTEIRHWKEFKCTPCPNFFVFISEAVVAVRCFGVTNNDKFGYKIDLSIVNIQTLASVV